MDPVTIGLVVSGLSLAYSAFSGWSNARDQRQLERKQAAARKRAGRVLAEGYRDQAATTRLMGERGISDIRRMGITFKGEQTASYGTMGGRVRGEGAMMTQEDIDIGEFDTAGYRAEKEASLTKKYSADIENAKAALDAARENAGPDRDEWKSHEKQAERDAERRLENAKRNLKNVGKEAARSSNKAEESWGINTLSKMALPDLESALDRRVRETGGSLMTVQNQTLEALEEDVRRMVGDTRREMVRSYKAAREARKSGQTVGGAGNGTGMEYIIGAATDFANLYLEYKMKSPDMPPPTTGSKTNLVGMK